MTAIDWILGNDTGISSETIWEVMTGQRIGRLRGHWPWNTPSDAGDFGRCHRLLERFPEWRARLPEVAARHPSWAPLVREWDRIDALYVDGDPLIRELEALQAEAVLAAGGRVERRGDGTICGMEYPP